MRIKTTMEIYMMRNLPNYITFSSFSNAFRENNRADISNWLDIELEIIRPATGTGRSTNVGCPSLTSVAGAPPLTPYTPITLKMEGEINDLLDRGLYMELEELALGLGLDKNLAKKVRGQWGTLQDAMFEIILKALQRRGGGNHFDEIKKDINRLQMGQPLQNHGATTALTRSSAGSSSSDASTQANDNQTECNICSQDTLVDIWIHSYFSCEGSHLVCEGCFEQLQPMQGATEQDAAKICPMCRQAVIKKPPYGQRN